MNLKIICFAAIFSCIAFFAQGQDTIQIKYNYGTKFYYQGKIQRPNKVLTLLESNPAAYKQMRRAIGSRTFGDILGGVGGFMVGYTLGNSIGRKKLDKRTLIYGGVLVAISLPLSFSYNKASVKAVRMYNEGLRTLPTVDGAMIELQSNEDGIGLRITF